MSESRKSVHGSWSGKWVFILAAAGSAIGLGNLWKFPYITGDNGGGAFVLVYLICVVIVGLPIMITEILMGRRGRSTPINTMRHLIQESAAHPAWRGIGWLGMAAGFLILSYYSVIAGWVLAYFIKISAGTFTGTQIQFANDTFGELVGDPWALLLWHTIFILMTIGVVARGVEKGLERSVRTMMPALFVILLIMVGYAMSMGEFSRAVEFMFKPDFEKLTPKAVLIAMGHAFFTLSLGMGAIMIYGAYLPRNTSIARSAFTIAALDTLVALLAGLAIFPIVFSAGMEPSAGPGLLFKSLPIAFGQMPGGSLFGGLFFLLTIFAAWTSAISLVEPAVTWMIEAKGMSRFAACVWVGGITWLLGIGTLLSFNVWADVTVGGKTFFDIVEFTTSNIMLPLGGLLMSIFLGWMVPSAVSRDELRSSNPLYFSIWYNLLRYVTPIAVFTVFLFAIGVVGE